MDIISLETAISAFSQIVENLSREIQQVKVEGPDGSIVILTEEIYENLLGTLEYLSAPGLLNKFRDAKLLETLSVEEASSIIPEIFEDLCKDSLQLKIESDTQAVVLLSEETYDHLLVTLEFLSAPGILGTLNDSPLLAS